MPVSPGASGMQPRDPCRPWRGTFASGHKPRWGLLALQSLESNPQLSALTVGWALSMICLSFIFKDNSQWMFFSQYVNVFGKPQVCDHLLTGESTIETFSFGSSTPLTHVLQMPLIGKIYRITYCFTSIQSTCCCSPLLHSCIKGFACCLRGYNYKLYSRQLSGCNQLWLSEKKKMFESHSIHNWKGW